MFPDERTILDGELYIHGWPLQKINSAIAVTRLAPSEETYQVEYHIFDVVSYNLNFEDRYFNVMKYKNLFTPDIKIRLVDTINTTDPIIANDFYALQVSRGYEGIMYRMGDCPYTQPKQPVRNGRAGFLSDKNNRCWHLLKRKEWQDSEFPVIGISVGEGKRAGKVGALICETPDHKRFGVGSGMTDEEAERFLINPPHLIKVKFLCYTSHGIPFNPTLEAVL
jgi:DNA ligase-1